MPDNATSDLPRLFISYSHKDVAFVERLTETLSTAGVDFWIDVEKIYAGRRWYREVEQALDRCDVMLLIVTPNSMRSEHVENEWQYYLDVRKPVVPVILQAARMPFQLRRIQYVDFENTDFDEAFRFLLQTLSELRAELKTPPTYHVEKRFKLEVDEPSDIFPDAAGIRRVFHEFSFDLFRLWLERASQQVRILQTWLPVTEFWEGLLTAAENGADLHILLLDPHSPFARQRSRDLGHNESDTPDNIWASLQHLSDLTLREPALMEAHLQVRLYNSLPNYPVYLADHRGFVGFFPHSRHSMEFPNFEIRTHLWGTFTPFGKEVVADFERRWEHARPIRLPITE